MKIVPFAIIFIAFIARVSTSQAPEENSCPNFKNSKATAKLPAGIWYQVVRTTKVDSSTCYFLSISGSGNETKIGQTSMYDGYAIKNTYGAAPNANGTWDITMNGGESSTVAIDVATKTFTVYTCQMFGALVLQSGVYSQSKKLSAEEMNLVKAELKKNKVMESLTTEVDRSKCD